MKVPLAAFTAALCSAFAAPAHAQDYGDPNGAVDPGGDPSGYYIAPPPPPIDPGGDPAAGSGYSVVPATQQPVDQSAGYDAGYDPAAYAQFEGELAPYGQWYDDPRYGRVWSPAESAVGSDFSPYGTRGHWSLTQYGWTWVSDYAWGWAPFHYGRWVTLASRGWAWIPGTTWGPAWVSWRTGSGYAGWAPLGPMGVALPAPTSASSCWHFVPVQQLGSARLGYVSPAVAASLYPRTAYYNPAQAMLVNQRVVRFNPGPLGLARPSAMAVAPLQRNAMPRASIFPQGGAPQGVRPWMGGGFRRPYGGPPMGGYRPAQPTYAQPTYAQPTYRPPTYAQPTYAPVYAQPSYGRQPAYRPAQPSYQAPHWGGGGGGHWGGGFGGGGRRGR